MAHGKCYFCQQPKKEEALFYNDFCPQVMVTKLGKMFGSYLVIDTAGSFHSTYIAVSIF